MGEGGDEDAAQGCHEADDLATPILCRSNVDLDKARGFLLAMARASGRKESGMLDTPPAGPECVAGRDRAVAEIRASNGQLPKRARLPSPPPQRGEGEQGLRLHESREA